MANFKVIIVLMVAIRCIMVLTPIRTQVIASLMYLLAVKVETAAPTTLVRQVDS
ncbi:MAG: hypothetical protein AAF630_10530 [Cyanobacteria bacterium P01_C01_bin.38]